LLACQANRARGGDLRDEVPYAELGGDYFLRREDQERLTKRLGATARTGRAARYVRTSHGAEVNAYF